MWHGLPCSWCAWDETKLGSCRICGPWDKNWHRILNVSSSLCHVYTFKPGALFSLQNVILTFKHILSGSISGVCLGIFLYFGWFQSSPGCHQLWGRTRFSFSGSCLTRNLSWLLPRGERERLSRRHPCAPEMPLSSCWGSWELLGSSFSAYYCSKFMRGLFTSWIS